MTAPERRAALAADAYDEQWARLSDFLKYNPGARHRRRLVNTALRAAGLGDGSLVDVGCGLGETIRSIVEEFPDAQLTGLDFSPHAIERCRSLMPEHRWDVADLSGDGFDASFDVVLCSEVLEHLDDPAAAIGNLARLVASDGTVVITVPHGRVHATERAVGHLHHPTIQELTQWLGAAGLAIERLECWGWPGYSLMKWVANLNPEAALETFGSGEYSRAMRALNRAAYAATGITSLRSSRHGVQTVVSARPRTET